MNKMLANIITLHSPFSKEKRPDVSIVFDVGEKKTLPTMFSALVDWYDDSVTNLTFEYRNETKRNENRMLENVGDSLCERTNLLHSTNGIILIFSKGLFRKIKIISFLQRITRVCNSLQSICFQKRKLKICIFFETLGKRYCQLWR